MKWKLSLFGYRESEVNEYVRNLAEVRDEVGSTYREKIRVAEDTRLKQDMVLEGLRREVGARRDRLMEVESSLIHMYYQFIEGQTATDPSRAESRVKEAGYDFSRRERKTMNKQKLLHTSFLGVAPKELAEYLIAQEKDHEEWINGLSDKLGKLEEVISAQNDEMRKLEELLAKPSMQEPFIDMAEHFLARFEQIMQETVKRTMKPVSGLRERGDAIPGSDDERLRERELIMRIARNRRKIRTLLRTMNQRRGESGTTGAAESGEGGAVRTGAMVVAEIQAETVAKTEVKSEVTMGANIVSTGGIASHANPADAELSANDDVTEDTDYSITDDSADTAISTAFDAAASAAAIIGINAAYTAAIKAASIIEGGDTDSTDTESAEKRSLEAETVDTEKDEKARNRGLRLLYLLDKRAGEDLMDEHGEILIRKGDSIDLNLAEEIDRRGLVDQLVKQL